VVVGSSPTIEANSFGVAQSAEY